MVNRAVVWKKKGKREHLNICSKINFMTWVKLPFALLNDWASKPESKSLHGRNVS